MRTAARSAVLHRACVTETDFGYAVDTGPPPMSCKILYVSQVRFYGMQKQVVGRTILQATNGSDVNQTAKILGPSPTLPISWLHCNLHDLWLLVQTTTRTASRSKAQKERRSTLHRPGLASVLRCVQAHLSYPPMNAALELSLSAVPCLYRFVSPSPCRPCGTLPLTAFWRRSRHAAAA